MSNVDLYELLKRPVALLDFETTDINLGDNRVIEFTAVVWDVSGRHELSKVVNPGDRATLDPKITQLTGITAEMMLAGTPSADAFEALWTFLRGIHLLIAHNAPFDLAFLNMELDRTAMPAWRGDFICTRAMATFSGTGITKPNRAGRPYLSTSLADVVQVLGTELAGTHRAADDVAATEAIFPPLYHRCLAQHRPILNAMVQPEWAGRPDYVPPRAMVYRTA